MMQPTQIESLRIGDMLDMTRIVNGAYPVVFYVEATMRGAPTPMSRAGDVTTFAVAKGGDKPATFDDYPAAAAFMRQCAKRFGVTLPEKEIAA